MGPSHGPKWGRVTTMAHAQMCDRDLRRCYCGAGFPEHRLIWSQGCTLSLSKVRQSHGPQRGRVTAMAHSQMCDRDLRRCYCGAGFPEHCLVWSQDSTCHSHRWDPATVLSGGGSQPWHMHRYVTEILGDAIVVQDSQNIA